MLCKLYQQHDLHQPTRRYGVRQPQDRVVQQGSQQGSHESHEVAVHVVQLESDGSHDVVHGVQLSSQQGEQQL